MTGLRAARIQAGYKTAKDAHKAFARGKRGDGTHSLSYFCQLEARGPALLSEATGRRLARLYGCSMNLIFAWTAPGMAATTTATKGNDDSISTHSFPRDPARSRAVAAE